MGSYDGLPQLRAPLTDEDRALLRETFLKAATAGGVLGAVAVIVAVFAVLHAIGNLGDPVDAGIGFTFTAMLLALVGVAAWRIRRTSDDRRADEKTIFTGTITAKHLERLGDAPRGPGQVPLGGTRMLVTLDGVDFRASVQVYTAVEPGLRVQLHCLRGQEIFRVVRL